jgi:hypothetical protein
VTEAIEVPARRHEPEALWPPAGPPDE